MPRGFPVPNNSTLIGGFLRHGVATFAAFSDYQQGFPINKPKPSLRFMMPPRPPSSINAQSTNGFFERLLPYSLGVKRPTKGKAVL